jgi:chromosome segregation ATPase
MGEVGVIVTGVDKLVTLLKQQGTMSISRAAKTLGVSEKTVEEWVTFLEEEDIVSLTYKFTTPYITLKKVTEAQVNKKVTKIEANKDIFVRRSETMLSFLDKEGDELNHIREEFATLKASIGDNFEHVKDEIKQLEDYEKAKREVDSKVETQRQDVVKKIKTLDEEITKQQKKYLLIMKEVDEEEKKIDREVKATSDMEQMESELRGKIGQFKSMIQELESKSKTEDITITESRKNVQNLKKLATETHASLEHEKEELLALIGESRAMEAKVLESQDKILKNLSSKIKNSKDLKEAVERFKKFFEKKNEVEQLISKINSERNELQTQLYDLIKKVKSVQIMKNASETDAEIKKFSDMFKQIDTKKVAFENEIHTLGKILKKW